MSVPDLVIITAKGLTLEAALSAFQSLEHKAGIGLFYEPTCCKFACLDDTGRLSGPDGRSIDVSRIFEARVFRESMELRWLKDPSDDQGHRAVILSEAVPSSTLGDPWTRLEIEKTPVIGTLPQTYLLWGEGTGKSLGDGWCELATPRIGSLPVPIPNVAPHGRVVLRTREYLAEYAHGNVAVFEERLVRLEVRDG
ncbi:MAG: type III-D CRISPR-associated protein Csx19 [Isosphaeraceae bacterium]